MILLALFALTPRSARAGYTLTDLGVLVGGSYSSGAAINVNGRVAGSSDSGVEGQHAVKTQGSGGLIDLGTLPGGRFSQGFALNGGGMVVGDSDLKTGLFQYTTHAFLASGPGSMMDLGLLKDGVASHATGINDAGQVVGYGLSKMGNEHAFLSKTGGGLTDLGTLGGMNSRANGINDSGLVVGSSSTLTGSTHAFTGTGPGNLTDLGSFKNGDGSSFGMAINASGHVAGFAGVGGTFHAFRGTANGGLEDLLTLQGTVASYGYAINSANNVVGSASYLSGFSHAFFYSDATRMIDLNLYVPNNSGWELTSASGINDKGQITGTGLRNGSTHAFLLTPTFSPVPEPSSLILTLIGLSGFLVRRSRSPADTRAE
ncbi:MAG: hypothetical protein NVSMB9_20860 [Isosphaeraceae bacterium]